MMSRLIWTVALSSLGALSCTPLPAGGARTIELINSENAEPIDSSVMPGQESEAPKDTLSDSGLIASGTDSSTGADRAFVYARNPKSDRDARKTQLPIHIHEDWWEDRARHLGISVAMAKERDSRVSHSRAPAGFWDKHTAVEAASVWTVLCNECHGGRRSIEDALEMPAPPANWGSAEGLFFGEKRAYDRMFQVVHDGGPANDRGRSEMPAWRRVCSNEMIWALLYFLEFQSGGIESRFPPSLYPRRPSMLREPKQ